jgi:uncharacterized membrane protein YhhN
MTTRTLSTIYFSIGIVCIAFETIGARWPALIVKALLMPVLFIIYYRPIKDQVNNFHRMIISALLFSWLGDITLEFQWVNEIFFMVGLSCFLIAQVLYLISFFSTTGQNILFFNKIYLLLPVILYGVIILYFLYGELGDMKVPVIVYTVVILSMLTSAINREKKVNRQSYMLILIGAILFVLSDSMIAIDKFGYSFPLSGIAVMITYITAQYLIALGCLKQFDLKLKT